MRLIIYFILFISCNCFAVTGSTCSEILMRFSHFVDIQDPSPSKKDKLEMIEAQLQFMYGAMANNKYKGVPKEDQTIKVLKTEKLDDNTVRVYYTYQGTALLEKGPRKYNTFPLPRIPTKKEIYEPAFDENGVNRAADPDSEDFGDYWYFWHPTKKGSPLKEGKHYDFVTADIERVKGAQHSLPNYEKLVDKKTGTIKLSAMFGMEDTEHSKNINRSKDLGAIGYRAFRKGLLKMGFVKEEIPASDRKKIFSNHSFRGYTLEKFTKDTPKGKIEMQLFFGQTGTDESSRAFHHVYKDALENSSVLIYDGHSGLGDYLDIDAIEEAEGFKIKHHPHNYQIMFFNSCTSYSYYNLSYHVLKDKNQPTKWLDIMTTGLGTEFDETQKANLALVKAVEGWASKGKKETYQSLARKMEASNLFAINGDDDNPKK